MINIFDDKYLDFVEIIFNLVKVKKDFHLLLLLFPPKKIEWYIAILLIKKLQYKYLDLYEEPFIKEQCPHFFDDSVELLYISDNISKNIEEFIDELHKKKSDDLIYEIYMRFLDKHRFISIKAENEVVQFMLDRNKQRNEKKECNLFSYLFKKCPNSKNIIISYIKEYQIEEDQFFLVETSENIKIISELLINNFFNSEDVLLRDFFNESQNIFNKLKDKIENYNIKYNVIKNFFADDESKIVLYKRLLIIYLMNNTLAKEKFELLSKSFYTINEIINDLEILIEDTKFFFNNNNNIDIQKVEELIETIKNSCLNYCLNNPEIIRYTQLIKETKERIPKKSSLIYNEIYKRVKELYPNDDCKCLNEADFKLNKFIPFLISEIKNNINVELKNIIQSLQMDEKTINNEINTLMKIFHIDNNNYKKKMTDTLLCLKYREKIIKILSAFKIIIEKTGVKKEFFSSLIDVLLSYLQKQEIVNTIQMSLNFLKKYSIDIFDEDDNFINLLIKLSDNEIIELLCDTSEETYQTDTGSNDGDYQEKCAFIQILKDKESIKEMRDKDLIKIIKDKINSIRVYSFLYGD